MIGPAIKWHLEANGCSQYKLAAVWGVNSSVITQLIKPESNPTWLTIKRVAKTLDINALDIVSRAAKIKAEQDEPK